MNKISCHVFLDLYPLVKDHIASEDSINLVKMHIEECRTCREIYGEDINMNKEKLHSEITYNENQIGRKINKSLMSIILFLLSVGIFLGVSINNFENIKYSIIIMPIIGYISYKLFRGNSYRVSFMIFISSYLLQILNEVISKTEQISTYAMLMLPTFLSIIYFVLFLLGVLFAIFIEYTKNNLKNNN